MRYRIWNARALGGMLCVVVLLAGCKTTEVAAPARPTGRPMASLESTRLELVKADQQVDATVAALDRLASRPGNVPQAYKVFAEEVSRTDTQARQAQLRAEQMRDQWQQYINAWEREVGQVSTPELQQGVIERRQAVRQNYDRLREAARELQTAYQPFVTHLREIERTLSLDATPQGVQVVEPAFAVTRKSAQNLKREIESFITEIDQAVAAPTEQTQVGSAAGQ
jgi:chromosome segregation ATPase